MKLDFLQGALTKISIYFVLFCLLSIVACKNGNSGIPFPAEDTGFDRPLAQPVQMGPPEKIRWHGEPKKISPLTMDFAFDKLPKSVYDSSDFISFPKAPEKIHFNMDSLPAKAFSLSLLPEMNLKAFPPYPGICKPLLSKGFVVFIQTYLK